MQMTKAQFIGLFALGLIQFVGGPADARFVGPRDSISSRLVVFVHGWGGFSTSESRQDTTWTSREGNVYWPRLVKSDPELGGVDVYVHDYQSGCQKDTSIVDLASDLRRKLEEPEVSGGAEIDKYRQVIFVAHSIGGLVVREALSLGRRHHDRIAGLFLFASPMSGTVMARYASSVCGGSIVRELAGREVAGSYLSQLNDRWVTTRPAIAINSWCATANADGVVTEPDSARLLCNRAIRSMAAGHIDLVKPNGTRHPSHELLRSWMRDAFPDLYARISERSTDIVLANCGESYYSSILQGGIMNVAARSRRRIRLSSLLSVDYADFSLKSLWENTPPAALVIHLSCFQRRWEDTDESEVQRTRDFISFLGVLEPTSVKVIVYSKAFVNNTYPVFFSDEDQNRVARRMFDSSRLYFVRVGTAPPSQDRYRRTREQQFVQSNAWTFDFELARALPSLPPGSEDGRVEVDR